MRIFEKEDLKGLFKPDWKSSGEDNGQVTIIGGSTLFHGAPILALKTTSRIVDMVFFSSPEPSLSAVVSKLKADLSSFIWVPWDEVDAYIEKSDAVLIGPGMMRYSREIQKSKIKNQNHNSKVKNYDREGSRTREITERLLSKFRFKKWVIDAGSLQTLDNSWIPPKAIITPNIKEFRLLFGNVSDRKDRNTENTEIIEDTELVKEMAKKYNCIIVAKGPETIVASPDDCVKVVGGNPGLTKGGSGDLLAGLTVALLAKNDPFLAACAGSFVEKAAADELFKKVGTNYNMDDLVNRIPETLHGLLVKGNK